MSEKKSDTGYNKLLFWLGFAFAVFQLVIPYSNLLVDLQLRAIHVAIGVSFALLVFGFTKNRPLSVVFIAGTVAACVNVFFKVQHIYDFPGEALPIDWVFGVWLLLATLEASRRATGYAIPVCIVLMLGYILYLGPLMPGIWEGPRMSIEFVLEESYYGAQALFGGITGYSATFISLLLIFGGLLEGTGVGKTFIDLAILVAGRFVGGPAKVAVVSSAMFGTISGSAVANVSVTGNYTIPAMKRLGYPPNFAGGVEAMASTGGIITPPIMGVAAFLMAEFLGIPYIYVCAYAAIPCLLFYVSIFAGVHFESLRLGLPPVPKDQLPSWGKVVTVANFAPLVIPVLVLLGTIAIGMSLTASAFYACIAVLVIWTLVALIQGKKLKEIGWMVAQGLSSGGQLLCRIVPILVLISLLVRLLGLSGVTPKIAELIIGIGGTSLIGALLIGCILPLLLGAPLPTTATYILTVSLLGSAFKTLGIDVIAFHLFVIYWAAIAAVTPPTCTTCIVAASIAGGNWLKVANVAMRLGLIAFLMPFFFVLEPALVGRGAPIDIIGHFVTAFFGAILLAAGGFGYFSSKLNYLERVLYLISGVLLAYPSYKISLVGLIIFALTFGSRRFLMKSKAPAGG